MKGLQYIFKTNIQLLHDPAVPLLCIYPREMREHAVWFPLYKSLENAKLGGWKAKRLLGDGSVMQEEWITKEHEENFSG